ASGRTRRAWGGGPAPPDARPDRPRGRPPALHLPKDGGPPCPEHLREDWGFLAGGCGHVRHAARPGPSLAVTAPCSRPPKNKNGVITRCARSCAPPMLGARPD